MGDGAGASGGVGGFGGFEGGSGNQSSIYDRKLTVVWR